MRAELEVVGVRVVCMRRRVMGDLAPSLDCYMSEPLFSAVA